MPIEGSVPDLPIPRIRTEREKWISQQKAKLTKGLKRIGPQAISPTLRVSQLVKSLTTIAQQSRDPSLANIVKNFDNEVLNRMYQANPDLFDEIFDYEPESGPHGSTLPIDPQNLKNFIDVYNSYVTNGKMRLYL